MTKSYKSGMMVIAAEFMAVGVGLAFSGGDIGLTTGSETKIVAVDPNDGTDIEASVGAAEEAVSISDPDVIVDVPAEPVMPSEEDEADGDSFFDETTGVLFSRMTSETGTEGTEITYEVIGDGSVGLVPDDYDDTEAEGLFGGAIASPDEESLFIGWVDDEAVFTTEEQVVIPDPESGHIRYFAVFVSDNIDVIDKKATAELLVDKKLSEEAAAEPQELITPERVNEKLKTRGSETISSMQEIGDPDAVVADSVDAVEKDNSMDGSGADKAPELTADVEMDLDSDQTVPQMTVKKKNAFLSATPRNQIDVPVNAGLSFKFNVKVIIGFVLFLLGGLMFILSGKRSES